MEHGPKKQPCKNDHGICVFIIKAKRKVKELRMLIHKFDIKSDELVFKNHQLIKR